MSEGIAYTLDGPRVALLMPVGYLSVGEGAEGVIEDDDGAPAEGMHPHLSVRRWRTDLPHTPTPAMAAELHLQDGDGDRRWDGPSSSLEVDGVDATWRGTVASDGSLGAVVAVPLGGSCVTFRMSWAAEEPERGAVWRENLPATRFLDVEDMAVPRRSVHHPLLRISVLLPQGWDVVDADDDTLVLGRKKDRCTIRRVEGEPTVDTTDAGVAASVTASIWTHPAL